MTKVPGWDYEKDEMLIELVKSIPVLYDTKCPRYNDSITKKKFWYEVGAHLDKKGVDCKDRWESLRGQHRKNLNRKRNKNGELAPNCRKWRYDDQMAFLKDYMKLGTNRSSTGEDDSASDGSNNDDTNEATEEPLVNVEVIQKEEDDPLKEYQQYVRKRQKPMSVDSAPSFNANSPIMNYLVDGIKEDGTPDPIDTFFGLMASSVKKFSLVDQHYVKNKVFTLVSQIEEKYIVQNQSQFVFPPLSPNISHYMSPSSSNIQTQQAGNVLPTATRLSHTKYES